MQILGERLATDAITTAQNTPRWLCDSERVPPWLNLSLALVYLSFAKQWLPFIPEPEIAKAVDRSMDDLFFDFADYTNFDLRVADVLVHPAEQAIYCDRWGIGKDSFDIEETNTSGLLSILFASRCNQYAADLRAGIIWVMEGKHSALGPVIFAYKRLNQHLWAVD